MTAATDQPATSSAASSSSATHSPSADTSAAERTSRSATDPHWWRQASVYQIYPRSFFDADGNGIGDLRGVTEKVPYLRELGIDAVWLSPFYPSQLADGGYDVDDYRDVDPKIGSLADFDAMISALHEAGIKAIVDIVPNHSSDQHQWFRQALQAAPGSAERDRYIFRDGTGEHGEHPPADWVSIFGGPAWTQVPDGQWYLHTFAREQPDFNWNNSEVRADFLKTLRFWSDRGVDGFRVDVAHGLAKRLDPVLPSQAELDAIPQDGDHPVWDRDEVHQIYAEWREVFNDYDPPRIAVAEAWVKPDRRLAYASQQGLGQAFNFDLLQAEFDAEQFREIVTFNVEHSAASGSSSTWVLSNHDVVRHPTRYGLAAQNPPEEKKGVAWLLAGGPAAELDAELGLAKARAATLFELALPGSAYLYQGEELGLGEVSDIPEDQRQDPAFFRNKGVEVGRDGCRVPLPWNGSGTAFGFSADQAHLPQPAWFADYAADIQDTDPDSTLNLYRRALRLRTQLQGPEQMQWLDTAREDVLAFTRPGGWICVTVFGAEPYTHGLDAEPLLCSSPTAETTQLDVLPGHSTTWFAQT